MVNQVYDALTRYFNTLENVGYIKYNDTKKVFLYATIQWLLDNDFRGFVTEDDYKLIQKVLYCLYGSTCLIPYPDYYNNKTERVMYRGSTSELAHRVTQIEKSVETLEQDWQDVKDAPVVVPKDM